MKPRYNWIPTELSQSDFNEFVFPQKTSGRRGSKPKISYFKMFNYFLYLMYTGCQWHQLPIDKAPDGKPEISYSRLFRHFQSWIKNGFFDRVFEASVAKLAKESLLDTRILHGDGTMTAAKKGGITLRRSGHKHLTGDKVVALCDRNCNVIAPFVTAPGNANETKLFPDAFNKLKDIAKGVGMDILGSVISLDGAYDSKKIEK